MGKLLFWAVIIIGGLLLARIIAHHNARPPAEPRRRKATASAVQSRSPEAMVRCEHCKVHLPTSEAVMRDGRYWCSVEHSRLGTRQ